MRNPTVRDVIEFLQTCDQNALVCKGDCEVNGKVFYSTVEVLKKAGIKSYIDDSGEDRTGNVVAIY